MVVGPWEYRVKRLPSSLPSSIWQTPEMLVEIETAWSLSGYLLVCFSAGRSCFVLSSWEGQECFLLSPVYDLFPIPRLGYFIHDTVDIVVSHQSRASWEYLVHHVMVSEQGMWNRPGASNLI